MEDRKVILAVDDMSMNLRTIQVILDKQFNVRLAKSGEIALSVLGSSKVDLILLDIEMPGMSGFEFLDVLKKLDRAKDVPVIFVTSHASTDLIARATKAGAKDYVMKPFEPAVLQKKVYAALDMQDIYITKDGKAINLPPQ
ncbi:MAG: response regulator [Treponema sp.]|jgi:putative two-component system response regulator|nr:response regulator [Treponema sp.]